METPSPTPRQQRGREMVALIRRNTVPHFRKPSRLLIIARPDSKYRQCIGRAKSSCNRRGPLPGSVAPKSMAMSKLRRMTPQEKGGAQPPGGPAQEPSRPEGRACRPGHRLARLSMFMLVTGFLWPSAPPTNGPDLLLPLCIWLRPQPRRQGSSSRHHQRVWRAGAEAWGNTEAGAEAGAIWEQLEADFYPEASINHPSGRQGEKTQPSFPFYLFILCFVYSDSGQFP